MGRGLIIKAVPFVLCVLLLSGCGSEEPRAALDAARERLENGGDVAVTARVTAQYDDRADEYVLRMTTDGESRVVELLEPELIAGVRVRASADGRTLEYGGVILPVADYDCGLGPVGALPALLDALENAHADEYWREDGLFAVRLTPRDEYSVTVWLTPEGEPVRAEFVQSSDGLAVLRAELTECEIR